MRNSIASLTNILINIACTINDSYPSPRSGVLHHSTCRQNMVYTGSPCKDQPHCCKCPQGTPASPAQFLLDSSSPLDIRCSYQPVHNSIQQGSHSTVWHECDLPGHKRASNCLTTSNMQCHSRQFFFLHASNSHLTPP